MASYEPLAPSRVPAAATAGLGRPRWRAWLDWLHACATACADYYRAAAIYEALSALSDAELARHGLCRENLARDICAGCDRTLHRRPA
jgi:hypothetical protein